MSSTTTAEALLLLAYEDVGGKQAVKSTTLRYGLAGATLVDLAMAGRIDVVDGKVVVQDATPTGTPYVDDVLHRVIEQGKQRKPHWWVEKLSGSLRRQVLDALVDRGLLRHEEHKVLGLFAADRYPGAVSGPEDEIRTRLRAAVLDGATPEPATAALVAVARACAMEKQLFPGLDPAAMRAAKTRMKEISEGDWAGAAVKRAIDEMNAAVMAAVTASVAAGAVASSS